MTCHGCALVKQIATRIQQLAARQVWNEGANLTGGARRRRPAGVLLGLGAHHAAARAPPRRRRPLRRHARRHAADDGAAAGTCGCMATPALRWPSRLHSVSAQADAQLMPDRQTGGGAGGLLGKVAAHPGATAAGCAAAGPARPKGSCHRCAVRRRSSWSSPVVEACPPISDGSAAAQVAIGGSAQA